MYFECTDKGLESLAGARMAQLMRLALTYNQMGNAGATALASACASGALGNPKALALDSKTTSSVMLAWQILPCGFCHAGRCGPLYWWFTLVYQRCGSVLR